MEGKAEVNPHDERNKEDSGVPTDSTKFSSHSSSKEEDTSLNANNSSVDPNMDFDTPCWFYQDSFAQKQGPFSFREMFMWWKSGYFQDTLLVRTSWQDHFIPLVQTPQFWGAPIKLVERIEREHEESLRRAEIPAPNANSSNSDDPSSTPSEPTKYETYVVTGGFNPITGRFQKDDSNAYYASKGLPSDRDTRMMAHYFDYNQYAQQMAAAAAQESKKKKQVKGSKKFWKDRKEKKRRAKLIAEYLAD